MSIFFFLLFRLISGINLFIREGSQKCFFLSLPAFTVVLGSYNLIDVPPADEPNQGITVRVYDSTLKILFSRLVRGPGKFTFTSKIEGVHKVCLKATAPRGLNLPNRLKFQLQLNNTRGLTDHHNLACKNHFQHLEEIIEDILKSISEITTSQAYTRELEANYNKESEKISWKIIYFTCFQTIFFLFSGLWQAWCLNSFFKSRHLN